MESDLLAGRIVRDMGLIEHFEVETEEEAVVVFRERLLVQKGKGPGEVHVIYLDRDFEFSKEVLNAMHREFVRTREAQAVLRQNQPNPGTGL